MRIKEIYIKEFGPYHEWSFTPAGEGVQVIYGPNESGKTSLLEALRFLLFGKKVNVRLRLGLSCGRTGGRVLSYRPRRKKA